MKYKNIKRKSLLRAIFNGRNIAFSLLLIISGWASVLMIIEDGYTKGLIYVIPFVALGLWALIVNTKDEYKMCYKIYSELNNEDTILNVKENDTVTTIDELTDDLKESTTHELKILPSHFNEVINNNKRFEIRKDDRDYKVGDFILLKEYEDGEYTGRTSECLRIKYILRNCSEYGLVDGYCIIGW